jgi:hypothetical protein
MLHTESDIVTALNSSTTATTATLRTQTMAGTGATVDLPTLPTRIWHYVPVSGGQTGYIISVCADVFGTRADLWLRNGERREGGRERWRNRSCLGERPRQPRGFLCKNDLRYLCHTMQS